MWLNPKKNRRLIHEVREEKVYEEIPPEEIEKVPDDSSEDRGEKKQDNDARSDR